MVLACGLYAPTVGYEYTLDDNIYTTENRFVREPGAGLSEILGKSSLYGFNGQTDSSYRPLTLLTFVAEARIFGLNPTTSHAFSVSLYALACVGVFLLLRRLPGRSDGEVLAFAAALLFTVHPVHTEVVANVKGREELLVLLFGLSTLGAMFSFARTGRWSALLGSALLSLASALCKETGVAFLVLAPLALVLVFPLERQRRLRAALVFGGVACAYLALRVYALGALTFNHPITVTNNALAAATSTSELWATRVSLLGRYVELLLAPVRLGWDYSYPEIHPVGWSDEHVLTTLAGLGATALVIARLTHARAWLFMAAVFALTLLPSSNLLILIESTFAVRALFVPSLAFCAAVAALMTVLAAPARSYLLATLALTGVIFTERQTPAWRDNQALFTEGVLAAPRSARARFAYGDALRRAALSLSDPTRRAVQLRAATTEFETGLSLDASRVDARLSLASIYQRLNERALARLNYESVLRLDPGAYIAWNELGVLALAVNGEDEAERCFRQALALKPDFPEARANLELIAVRRNLASQAEMH